MTHVSLVLLALADGEPKSLSQLTKASGLTRIQTAKALTYIESIDLVSAQPVRFSILPAGVAKLSRIVVEPVAPERKFTPPEDVMSPSAVVESAKRSRSPLESAWGASA